MKKIVLSFTGLLLLGSLTCSATDLATLMIQAKKNEITRALKQAEAETAQVPVGLGAPATGHQHNLHVNPEDADIPAGFKDYDKAALTSTTNKHLVESYEQTKRHLEHTGQALHQIQGRVIEAHRIDAQTRATQLRNQLTRLTALEDVAHTLLTKDLKTRLELIAHSMEPAINAALTQQLEEAKEQQLQANDAHMIAFKELRDNILRYSDAARAADKSRQEMATTIAAAAAEGEARQRLIEDHRAAHENRQHAQRTQMAKLLMAGIPLAVITTVLGYYIIRHKFQPRPQIIEAADTSIRGLFERLRGVKPPASNLNELILSPDLSKKVLDKFTAIGTAVLRKMPLSNLLFYGPAGTGKTMAAQAFARKMHESGSAHHVIIRGGAFKRFTTTNQAQKALADTLRWAAQSDKPVILIFDEAETMFCDRESEHATELTRDLTVTMLSFFEKAISKKMMFILSTNLPHRLDRALLNRIDPSNRVKFLKPGLDDRVKLIDVYLNKHVAQNGVAVPQELRETYSDLASRMDGLVGRQVESWAVQSLYEAIAQQLPAITPQVLNDALSASTQQTTLSAY